MFLNDQQLTSTFIFSDGIALMDSGDLDEILIRLATKNATFGRSFVNISGY